METLKIIKDRIQLGELYDYIRDRQYLAFDTETTGTSVESKIIGFSIAADVDIGYYVILSFWDPSTNSMKNTNITKDDVFDILRTIKTKDLIMHNAIFDCMMVQNNFAIDLMPSVHTDTMILAHLLDENRSCGLKELAVTLFGEDSKKEQLEMKESVTKNGGMLTKQKYELYKADADLIARYGAKDTILTFKVCAVLLEELYRQKLDKFFYEEESMPLLRGPTYDLNKIGLKVDIQEMKALKTDIELECSNLKAFIHKEIESLVKDKYPATNTKNTFNIGASQQLGWLLFDKMKLEFNVLTDAGRQLCKSLSIQIPYSISAKKQFIELCKNQKGMIYETPDGAKKIRDYWVYLSTDKKSLKKHAKKNAWIQSLLEYSKQKKILTTYVEGILDKTIYGIIHPSFLQHGTTSGRYSSKQPNFQNLPKKDKRIKSCIIPRNGKVFVGADYSQLEPRVFASISKDERLLQCFKDGKDFYSVVGAPIFEKTDCSMFKDDKDSFANKYPALRDLSKAFALATPYGTSAFRQSQELELPQAQCQEIIDKYFAAYPKVELMMLESHEQAKSHGVVHNLFGRPRRIPEAMEIPKTYDHGELPYDMRTLLNLAMNHRVQSTASGIVNRVAIAIWKYIQDQIKEDLLWEEVKIVLQVHDSIILEGPKELAKVMAFTLQYFMENTIILPGVSLEAKPLIGNNLAEV